MPVVWDKETTLADAVLIESKRLRDVASLYLFGSDWQLKACLESADLLESLRERLVAAEREIARLKGP